MSWRRAGKAFLMWAAGITVLVMLAVAGIYLTPTRHVPHVLPAPGAPGL